MNRIIDEEIEQLPDTDPCRVFIGGFSQGAIVVEAALMNYKREKPLGGVIGLSGLLG